ncbi:FAD/NAD(P)-binding protein [Streptomyces hygroscopicus]|uniref:FAD/NAD(P)-binding protein n=1 Tax=Streptomyces hygroscopicus TaxID=1912 RepID=UPI001FCB3B00|nr:FAD/NAD(P)-binding protein [Streptomyces hygroscopicus]BDH08986.1 adenylate cyclase [Streptomyces hygroscopicus]
MNDHTGPARSLCIIGCGPRGASIVERILANVPALYGDRPLDLHIVDPYPPGAGRTWRTGQSGLLWMNSAAEQVTMYPDESVECDGPPRPGPTTAGWLDAPLHDGAYAARRDQGRYLRHFFATVTRERPASVRLYVHRARVTDLRRTPADGAAADGRGRQQVILDSGEPPFLADRVVFAQGHTETLAAPVPAGLTRIGPGPADAEALERIPGGAPVVVRGLGLVFIDCLALLTEGRGGRFTRTPDGALRYLPSGREPRLYAGSRRGVPLPPKPAKPVPAAPATAPAAATAAAPRFATVDACRARLSRPGATFARDAWPLVVAELGWCHYRALFAEQPARTRMSWQDFDAQYAVLITDADRLAKLARAAVPDPADRLDLDRLAAPLAGLRFAGTEDLQRQLRGHLAEVLQRRTGPARGVDTALVDALQRVGSVIEELWRSGGLDAHHVDEALRHFALGTYLSSGPPPLRAAQLLALAEAGIVTFVGPGMRVVALGGDEAGDEAGAGERAPGGAVFRASSPAVPGAVHEAAVLLDARLAAPAPDRVTDPLLRALLSRGELVQEHTEDGAGGMLHLSGAGLHPVDASGAVHRDRIIAGPAQFPRPHTNAVYFRQNDALARGLLTDG